MKTKREITPKFYQNLGKLFYAVAASDKQVRDEEFNKLKALVKKQWLNADIVKDDFNSNAVRQIEYVFEWLHKNEKLNAQMYFDDFINYKNEHPHLFTKNIRKLIMKTAGAIASSFSGLNKSELIMLAKLDMELKK
ncbi:hypothetical protein [Flavivirga rizhaonensis]|uniref:TerB family tellurite resistance protein n=1 Tax=Flavivirga rizhaonensis TaxID=2559571 RepID=A0A4S1E1F5_9FLAO|nr:hypothetical protein [Flavivirga rizhaonensis]TGV04339.1 hypothetical protein EM932_02130 [Flavivirga rizhaonensis]